MNDWWGERFDCVSFYFICVMTTIWKREGLTFDIPLDAYNLVNAIVSIVSFHFNHLIVHAKRSTVIHTNNLNSNKKTNTYKPTNTLLLVWWWLLESYQRLHTNQKWKKAQQRSTKITSGCRFLEIHAISQGLPMGTCDLKRIVPPLKLLYWALWPSIGRYDTAHHIKSIS